MAEKTYFVLTATQDGDKYLDVYSKEDLERKLNDEDFGDPREFLPANVPIPDLDSWVGHIIIRGEIVAPTTSRWTLPEEDDE